MKFIKRARELRKYIEQAAVSLPDTDAIEAVELFPAWNGEGVEYAIGDRVSYQGDLYKVIMGHTSQSDWTPDAAVSLFVKVADPAIEWPEWVQPTGAHDAYNKGDKVSHNDKHWISTIDANVYEPPTLWEEQ